MQKDHHQLNVGHVVVDGDDVQAMAAHRFEQRRNFVFEHRDIPATVASACVPANAPQAFSPIRALMAAACSRTSRSGRPIVMRLDGEPPCSP